MLESSGRENLETGMKAEIDKYISINYQKLVCIAQKKISYFGRSHLTAEGLVATAYLEVVQKPPTHKEDIGRYFGQFIHQETYYEQSKTNRLEKCREISINGIIPIPVDNIEYHILISEWKDEYEAFRNTLTREEQIVSDVYFHKGKRTTRELADHFGIAHTSAYIEFKELLNKIKEYEIKGYVQRIGSHYQG
jgi:hypothetical protein